MKKALIVFLVLFVLGLGAFFAVMKMAPLDRIREEAVAQVKEKTGRNLSFRAAEIMFWPSIGVQLKDARLSNAVWASEGDMIALGALDIRLAVMPLLKKQVEVSRIVLQEPIIHLEKSREGKANWDFSRAGETPEKPSSSSVAAPQGFGFKFGGFQIVKGRITFKDWQKGTQIELEAINIKTSMADLGSPLDLEGSFEYNKAPVQISLGLDRPADFAGGKSSPGRAELKAASGQAKITGVFSTGGALLREGVVSADISSLSQLAAWLGGAKTPPQLPFEKISAVAKAEASAAGAKLSGASLRLDEIEATGDVTVDLSGVRPDILARLGIGKINLDRFMVGAGESTAAAPQRKGSGWDTTPIDFSSLKNFDAALILQTQGFSLRGIEAGPARLTVALKEGRLQAESSETALLGGKFSSVVSIDAARLSPALAFRLAMSGVQAQPILAAFAHFNKLQGTADADINVTTSGGNQRAMIDNLAGKGAFVFRNGSLSGIDLVNIAQLVQRRLQDIGIGSGKTDFVELGGTFTAASGIFRNKDLSMRGPLLQASGAGDINLPLKYVTFRVTPVLTASAAAEARGIGVPVDISGPFDALKIRPDFRGVMKDLMENPEEFKSGIKNILKQGKPAEQILRDLRGNPGQFLQGLVGGGKDAVPEPEPER